MEGINNKKKSKKESKEKEASIGEQVPRRPATWEKVQRSLSI